MNKHNKKVVTVQNGYWYFFEVDAIKIAVHGSAVSGKESVYVDDELVAEKRSLGLKSNHQFKIKEVNYSVQLKVKSLLKGEVECLLYKEDQLIATESKAFYIKDNKKTLLTSLFLGFLTGITIALAILTYTK